MNKILPYLAIAFSGFFIYLFDKIWGDVIDWKRIQTFPIGKFLNIQFSLLQIVVFILIALLFYFIGKKIIKRDKSYYSKKELEIKKFNRLEIHENNTLLKWDVFFDFSGKPAITRLTAFCKNHGGAPLRFVHNRCPFSGCDNSYQNFNEHGMKNAIESELLERWDNLK